MQERAESHSARKRQSRDQLLLLELLHAPLERRRCSNLPSETLTQREPNRELELEQARKLGLRQKQRTPAAQHRWLQQQGSMEDEADWPKVPSGRKQQEWCNAGQPERPREQRSERRPVQQQTLS